VRKGREARLWAIVLIALTVSCADLWTKVALPTPDWALHQRSLGWAIGCWLLLAAILPQSRVPSGSVALGSGLFTGGVLGNLISAGTDHLMVPNPLFFQTDNGAFAFNLADASILVGNLILMVAFSYLVISHRDRLPRRQARRG
jgi:lipoprotein signal peptidase